MLPWVGKNGLKNNWSEVQVFSTKNEKQSRSEAVPKLKPKGEDEGREDLKYEEYQEKDRSEKL